MLGTERTRFISVVELRKTASSDCRLAGVNSQVKLAWREVWYNYPASGVGEVLNRLDNIADDSSGTNKYAQYTYLGAGTIVQVAHPAVDGGLNLTYGTGGTAGFDRFGRIANQKWTNGAGTATLDEYSYTYDRNGNRTSKANLLNSSYSENYAYDGLNRLPDTNRGGSDYQDWGLDALGNWAEFTDGATTQEREVNAANEITNIDVGITPEYDAAGNMIEAPVPGDNATRNHYVYDAWNRLAGVYVDDDGEPGDAIALYKYDGQNQRIEEIAVEVNPISRELFFNDRNQIIEVTKDGDLAEQYVWDVRYVNAPVLRDRFDAEAELLDTMYYCQDANWDVTALVDGTVGSQAEGEVVERYAYSPYGAVSILESDWDALSSSAYENDVLFQGMRRDSETGLYFTQNRIYHIDFGWLQRDLIGYLDGMNLYQFVQGNPVTSVDPTGLVTLEQINEIAEQMGLEPLKGRQGPATELIGAIQRKLDIAVDGDFGPKTAEAYEAWAQGNNVAPVELRDSKTAQEVAYLIGINWPASNLKCPLGRGGFLALIYYESRDPSTRTGGKAFTYFNAIGGPYGSKGVRTTAVGLAQFTEATAEREIAYDAQRSIERALELLYEDAATFGFDPQPQRALNRWEAWRTHRADIIEKGKMIDALIERHGGWSGGVPNAELNQVLGIE